MRAERAERSSPAAGGGGGHALHRALHGGRHRRRADHERAGDAGGGSRRWAGARRAVHAAGVYPGAARAMPRPGSWMETFKQALAFPMYASAAWAGLGARIAGRPGRRLRRADRRRVDRFCGLGLENGPHRTRRGRRRAAWRDRPDGANARNRTPAIRSDGWRRDPSNPSARRVSTPCAPRAAPYSST